MTAESTVQASPSPLTVVMPVYNEAANLGSVLDEIRVGILDLVAGSELLVIDDHSTDDSPAVLAAAALEDGRITVVRNEVNVGHGPSVRRGWDASTSDFTLTIDSDGQIDLGEFPNLWAATGNADLVLGARVQRGDPWHRRLVTGGTRALAIPLARRRLRDANTPFKIVRTSLLRHLTPAMPTHAFAPSVLLIIGACRSGAHVVELPVRQLPRLHGRSTLNTRKLARAVTQCVRETTRYGVSKVDPYVR